VSDIKLFRLESNGATELTPSSVVIEKSLQTLMERHLETFLGVTFLTSEHITGKVHGGRIDSLGIDENRSPVIIEYKRSLNENVINQGLFYLDWLLDHRAEFTLLAMKQLGAAIEGKIDWAGTRLICVAHDFTKYDEHAVSQIDRNVELIRYRTYGSEMLLLELVNAKTASVASIGGSLGGSSKAQGKVVYRTVSEYLDRSPQPLVDLYEGLKAFLVALGDDVQVNVTQQYFAFRRIKNFACVEVHPTAKKLLVFVKVNPDSVSLEPGLTRDVRKIGHFGTGDLEITIDSDADFERAKPLLVQSYNAS
jgi:predicted transport protein